MQSSPLLLCTDLDRTLLPNGTQPESGKARDLLSRFVKNCNITLAYVTGRHKSLVEQAIKCYSLPVPDLVISDVGTKIYDLRAGEWTVWQQWETEIDQDWNGFGHQQLIDLFRDLKPLQVQEHEKQNTHKLSYYVPLHVDHDYLMQEMEARLQRHEVRASLIWSIDEPAGIGLLDVLPRGATKLHAIQFIREQLGFSLSDTVFAGDSGNDLPVMLSDIPSVLVANATDDVRETVRSEGSRRGYIEHIYFARGDFMDMNGNYSAGVLEGVCHFKPALRDCLAGA